MSGVSLSIIAAVAANGAIGKNNRLLCHIPGDLQRFKQITMHHTVIMGRKTFESLPQKPLPDRRNIVITTHNLSAENVEIVRSLQEALKLCTDEKEAFIIGGGMVYRESFALADRLYLTQIGASLDGDTFFPDISLSEWKETYREEHPASGNCPYPFAFVNYERFFL